MSHCPWRAAGKGRRGGAEAGGWAGRDHTGPVGPVSGLNFVLSDGGGGGEGRLWRALSRGVL